MKKFHIRVVVEQARDGSFGAYSPDMPGWAAGGDTLPEVMNNMEIAINAYLEALQEQHQTVQHYTGSFKQHLYDLYVRIWRKAAVFKIGLDNDAGVLHYAHA